MARSVSFESDIQNKKMQHVIFLTFLKYLEYVFITNSTRNTQHLKKSIFRIKNIEKMTRLEKKIAVLHLYIYIIYYYHAKYSQFKTYL